MIAAGGCFSICYPFAVFLIYVGYVGFPGSKMWSEGSWYPNTPHGVFLILLRYLGLGMMAVGVAKMLSLPEKIRRKWRQIRGV
jgi:predicted phage tail protein